MKRLYQVEGSKDKLPMNKLYSVLRAKGYKGSKGAFWIAAWLGGKGRKLYEIQGRHKHEVGKITYN